MTPDSEKGSDDTQTVFGEVPDTEPLNDRLRQLGYTNMHPVSNLGTVSGLFLMEVIGLLIMMFSYFCHNKTGSMLASRIGINMKSFFLWGTMINIVMMAYLPMLMATFISCVGMQWGEEVDTPMLLSNLWTIFMMCSWIAGPVFLFIIFAYRREQIGMRSPML